MSAPAAAAVVAKVEDTSIAQSIPSTGTSNADASNADASNALSTTAYVVPDDVSFINVGGDIFAMKSNVPAISLLYEDYTTFQKTFTVPPYPANVVQLLTTYMRWHGWNNSTITFTNVDDKNGLLEVLRTRI